MWPASITGLAMDFQLTDDQRAVEEAARRFAADRLAPNAAAWDEKAYFPVEVLRESASLGFASIYIKGDVVDQVMDVVQNYRAGTGHAQVWIPTFPDTPFSHEPADGITLMEARREPRVRRCRRRRRAHCASPARHPRPRW